VLHAEDTNPRDVNRRGPVPYDQLEKVAVLQGDCAPPQGSRDVPEGRWSYHPDASSSDSFPHRIRDEEAMLPRAVAVEADEKGGSRRSRPQGVRVETTYETRGALTYAATGPQKATLRIDQITGPTPSSQRG